MATCADSFTYDLSHTLYPASCGVSNNVASLIKGFSWLINQWSIAQTKTITQQVRPNSQYA